METRKTSSTVIVDTGEQLFKVDGHSQVTGADTCLTSETFRVGGHDWAILYYPNGNSTVADGQFTSVFAQLASTIESDITASFFFCLQDPASPPPTGHKNKKSCATKFVPSMTGNQKTWGYSRFMSKDDLAASGCLVDDCLVIKCALDISILIEDDAHDHNDSIIVPASNLSAHLGDILERRLKPDLTVSIGNSESFSVNTCVLAARSPVFRKKLCGPMKESSVCIEDMDAKVFEALLHYIYNDCLPASMEENTEEATKMARDLLVTANGYGIERLKVMCERRLSRSLNVNTVSSALDLAVQYDCQQLKECCLKYMVRNGERLRAIKMTNEFEQLKKNHPLVLFDILDEVAHKLNSQDVSTPSPDPPAPALAPAP